MSSRMTDVLAYALAVGLAATCLAFAGYKVIKLRSMENPPADLGLNFPPPKRKIITDDSIAVDPMPTQSTAPPQDVIRSAVLQPYQRQGPVLGLRLLAVVDGLAFVEIETFRGKEIRPVAVGSMLPGAGLVDRIERAGNRWTLIAASVRLEQRQP